MGEEQVKTRQRQKAEKDESCSGTKEALESIRLRLIVVRHASVLLVSHSLLL
jgi:hypothetical protein